MLNLYRRHLETCPHRSKGHEFTKRRCRTRDGRLRPGDRERVIRLLREIAERLHEPAGTKQKG
jgi:hypothetical protein